MINQIKRFAGASAGAMTASLMAVGYDSKDIQGFLSQDMSKIFLGKTTDHGKSKVNQVGINGINLIYN